MKINRILIILTISLLLIVIIYLFNQKTPGDVGLKIKNQEKILKSIVKIEYKDNDNAKSDEENSNIGKWIGSGIIFSDKGLVLTNNHVIEDKKNLTSIGDITICSIENIGLLPNCDYKADLIIRNPELDLAILKIRDFSTDNYVKLFKGNIVNTSILGETINIYGYPTIGGSKITITKGIVSGFDNINNIKTDAEINGGNSGGGAFLGTDFIGVPSAVLAEETGKIGYIISENKVYAWFSSISKNNFNSNYSEKNFKKENLIFKGNNIGTSSSLETSFYVESNKECFEKFGKNSYFSGVQTEDSFLCDCKEGYTFGGESEDECVPIDYVNGEVPIYE